MKNILRLMIFSNLLLSLAFSQTYGKRFQLEEEIQSQQQQEQREELSLAEKERKEQQLLAQEVLLDRAVNSDQYIVGPGDGFSVVIETGEVLSHIVQIGPSGEMLIPTVGVLDVEKMTLQETIKKAENAIQQTYKNSQANVALIRVRKFKLQIAGAVNKSGFYNTTPVTRLDEILELSEGLHPFARDFAIRIERYNGDTEVVNYLNYLRTGDLESNPTFTEGDKIVVPYGDVEKEGIMIRGAVERSGYDLIETDETVEKYIQRGVNFQDNINLSKVFINRNEKSIEVKPQEFNSFKLEPGDKVNFISERGVAVNGFVQAPGGYQYMPGYTCSDYIGLAGGNTIQGDIDRVRVRHLNGEVEKGLSVQISPGDVIIVPRTRKNVIFGESSILEIITAVASVYLAYIAATN